MGLGNTPEVILRFEEDLKTNDESKSSSTGQTLLTNKDDIGNLRDAESDIKGNNDPSEALLSHLDNDAWNGQTAYNYRTYADAQVPHYHGAPALPRSDDTLQRRDNQVPSRGSARKEYIRRIDLNDGYNDILRQFDAL